MRGIWEHNGIGGILWSEDYPGASGRGKTLQEARVNCCMIFSDIKNGVR